MYPAFLDPRKAFQAKVCSRGADLGSMLSASRRRNVAPEFASNDRVSLCEGGGACSCASRRGGGDLGRAGGEMSRCCTSPVLRLPFTLSW